MSGLAHRFCVCLYVYVDSGLQHSYPALIIQHKPLYLSLCTYASISIYHLCQLTNTALSLLSSSAVNISLSLSTSQTSHLSLPWSRLASPQHPVYKSIDIYTSFVNQSLLFLLSLSSPLSSTAHLFTQLSQQLSSHTVCWTDTCCCSCCESIWTVSFPATLSSHHHLCSIQHHCFPLISLYASGLQEWADADDWQVYQSISLLVLSICF